MLGTFSLGLAQRAARPLHSRSTAIPAATAEKGSTCEADGAHAFVEQFCSWSAWRMGKHLERAFTKMVASVAGSVNPAH
jgi:hypothetical protein